jgi:hypothetical protein
MSKSKISVITNNELWDKAAKRLGLIDKTFFGGIERCDVTIEQLSYLLEIGFTWPEHRFNESATVETFFKFGKLAEKHGAKVVYISFLESRYRNNPMVVIEGVEVTDFPDSASLIMEFAQSFHGADEFTAEPELLRAWYD